MFSYQVSSWFSSTSALTVCRLYAWDLVGVFAWRHLVNAQGCVFNRWLELRSPVSIYRVHALLLTSVCVGGTSRF